MKLSTEHYKRIMLKIDRTNEGIAKVSASLMLGMTLMYFLITVLRYGFQTGSIALQESVVYMHSIAFLLTAAYALRRHYHVRVDLYYSKQIPRRKAIINLCGTFLLLLPVTLFWFLISIEYVFNSWTYLERSIEAAGLPGLFLLKTLLLITPLMLTLQGVSDSIRNILFLKGHLTEAEWE